MTLFHMTPELAAAIKSSSLDERVKKDLTSQSYISHTNLIQLYRTCKPTATYLELIKLTTLKLNNYAEPARPKTAEFLQSMQKLRLQAKELEYQKLVSPAPQHRTLYEPSDDELTPAQAHKQLKNQVTTIVNILISVCSVAYAVWYWTDTSWKLKDSYRVLLCLFFALLVLVAEVVVYMGYINKIEEAKAAERKKKEVKSVVRSVNIKKNI